LERLKKSLPRYVGPADEPELCERPNFRTYVEQAWHVVEPATRFVGGFHVDAIAEHLQAISEGLLQNLIINIPPRHSKSSLVSVLWPTWEWIDDPHLRWLFISYGQGLSTRDSVKRRRLIESSWYREQWVDRFDLTADQNQKIRFENDRTGVMIATSVGGLGTGEGGRRIVVDDPHAADEVESDTKRGAVLDWWDGTMATRADTPTGVARVIVMQRLHERDLVGHILELAKEGGEQYDHLILPAEYEPRAQVCMAGLEHDPRTEPGELLSPDRFGPEAMARLKVSLGPERAAGQLQQRPAPPGGAIFHQDWWADAAHRYDPDDPLRDQHVLRRWLHYDTAYKETRDADFTGCAVWELLTDYRMALRWVWQERLEMPRLLAAIEADTERWNRDGKLKMICIEDAGSGMSAAQTLRASSKRELAKMIYTFVPRGSKEYRGRQASVWCSRGAILLPHPSGSVPWLDTFAGPEGDLFRFPTIEHDDTVDAFVQGILRANAYLEQWFRKQQRRPAA
jgi:phage terminase large subunit-like protein